jgi:hypothetical protein
MVDALRPKVYVPGVERAIGMSVHTGWAACVVVGGSLRKPEIIASSLLEMLSDPARFCFHRAAEMPHEDARACIARARAEAIDNARRALAPLLAQRVAFGAIVAKQGAARELREVLESHPRIHAAEGLFYRDVLREACSVPTRIVPPSELDVSKVGRLAPAPWGRDQKLAALAAWTVLERSGKAANGQQ